MRYYYRRYRFAKELKRNCRLNAPKKDWSFYYLGGKEKTEHTVVASKDVPVPKEPFVDWFSRCYLDNFPTFRNKWKLLQGINWKNPKVQYKLNEMVKYFNDVLIDLRDNLKVISEIKENGITKIYIFPSRNEFIEGFWYRILFKNKYAYAIWVVIAGKLLLPQLTELYKTIIKQ